jgi:hypothetical protein
METIRQGLAALDQKTQEPLESDTYRATNITQGNSFHKQTFDEALLVSRDEVLLAALDKQASTIMAVMVLFAVMNVTVFLKLGGLAPWTDVSDHHGELLTSAGWGRVLGQP